MQSCNAILCVQVWDACTGVQLHEFAHSHIVRTAAFQSNSNKLATGGETLLGPCFYRSVSDLDSHVHKTGHDKLIRIFDLDAPEAAPQILPQASSPIRNLMFLQEDNVMVCALLDSPGIK